MRAETLALNVFPLLPNESEAAVLWLWTWPYFSFLFPLSRSPRKSRALHSSLFLHLLRPGEFCVAVKSSLQRLVPKQDKRAHLKRGLNGFGSPQPASGPISFSPLHFSVSIFPARSRLDITWFSEEEEEKEEKGEFPGTEICEKKGAEKRCVLSLGVSAKGENCGLKILKCVLGTCIHGIETVCSQAN